MTHDEREDEQEDGAHWMWSSGCGRLTLALSEDDAQTGHPYGQDASEGVAWLLKVPRIVEQVATWDAAILRDVLSEYGAWSASELADHERNLERMVWLACGDMRDNLFAEGTDV